MRLVISALCVVLFLCTGSPLFAQRKGTVRPNYKQAELYSPDYLRQRIYSTSVSPQWIGETDRFWYSFRTSQGTRYYLVDPAKPEKLPLFDHQKLAERLSVEVHQPLEAHAMRLSDTEIDDEGKVFSFTLENTLFELELATGQLTNKGEKPKEARRSRQQNWEEFQRRRNREQDEEKKDEKKDPRAHRNFSPDHTAYVFVQDYDLYYVEASEEVKAQIKAIDERMKKEKEEQESEEAEEDGTVEEKQVQEKEDQTEEKDVEKKETVEEEKQTDGDGEQEEKQDEDTDEKDGEERKKDGDEKKDGEKGK